MAPGVSAESRRTRGGTTVSWATSDARLSFRGDGRETALCPGNFGEKFGSLRVRFFSDRKWREVGRERRTVIPGRVAPSA